MKTLDAAEQLALTELLLSLADDKFILGCRNADWTGLGPILEEDIAFSSLAQDDIAHASALYQFIAEMGGRDANRLAYGRGAEEYRSAHLVELHDEFDWAVAIVRQFFCDHFDSQRLSRLAQSAHKPLKDLASRILAEERLAIGHADQWIVRLGKGTEDSRKRIQTAIDRLAPLAIQLFEPTEGVEQLVKSGIYPAPPGAAGDANAAMFDHWAEAIENVIEESTLHLELHRPASFETGGRRGMRSAAFTALHDELTEVYRVEPNAAW
jgi:ring-1,2-phenylacetyl-CoA epoxidase subunit PaaC